MKLYLVRHGQSAANIAGTYAGQTQSPLTPVGEAEADAAAALLRGMTFDRVYSSDLIRAADTCRRMLPGVEPIQTPLLREYDVGALAGKLLADCPTIYGETFLAARASGDYTAFGGESRKQVAARMAQFLAEAAALPCESVIAFSHRGAILGSLDAIGGGELPHGTLRCDNCSVSVLEYTGGVWRVALWNWNGVL